MLKDTTPEIEKLQNELWMKRTPHERVRFQMELFTASARGNYSLIAEAAL